MRCIRGWWADRGGRTALRWIGLILPLMLAENTSAQAQRNASTAAQPPALTTAQRERLKERDHLGKQATKLRSEGKLAEAIKAAEGKLAIERQVLGEASDDAIRSMELIASIQEQRDDWPAAVSTRRNVLNLRVRALGEAHWKVTDARLALQDIERRAAMTLEQRRKLAEATRLGGKVKVLYRAGKFGKALQTARRAQALRKEVLGERHRDYTTSLNNLAMLLYGQGDYAAARPLYERALAIKKEVLGERHPDYATSLNNLANLLQATGDYAGARPLYEQALAIRKAVLGERHLDYATSLNNLAMLLYGQGDYAGARPLYEQALAIRKAVLGERHLDYATSLNNLANLLYGQGDYAGARPLYEQALAIRKAVLGEQHLDYATSLNNLANLLYGQGDYAAARPLYERALAIKKEVLGERHPDYATSLNNLANLLQATGDYAGARPLYEQALAIRKAVLGEQHRDYATSLNNLAMLLYGQGDYAGARPLYEQALAIRKAVLGEQHRDYATSLNNLANLLYGQGDYAGARPLYEQALAIRKEVLGERHPDYATSLNNLANLLQATGDYAGARPLYERALAIKKEVLGERHPDYATSLNNLANLLQATGDYAGARPLYEQALAIRKAVLGERHLDYATSLNNLAMLLYGQGDYAGARPLYEQALAIRKEVLGERHRGYAASLNNLAELLREQGDYAGARPLYERALGIHKEVLGERHPDYAASLNNLAMLLYGQGDYAGARPLYEQALAIRKEVLGERHLLYAASLNNLANLLESQGDHAAARPLYERALAIRKEVLGERHPRYAESLNNLAWLLKSQGDYAAARPLYERALAIHKEVLGERHPHYAASLNNLAVLLHSQGDYAAARPLYERALAIRKEVLGERHPHYAQSLNYLANLLVSQGDYAAARSLHERAMAIRKEILGERHPNYAQSLSSLAVLLWAQRDYAGAERLLKQVLEIVQINLELAAAQSERQQLAMAQRLSGYLSGYLSLALAAQIPPESVYRHVLAAKGAVLERQRRHRDRRRLQADPGSEAARWFADYQQTVTRLAALAFATPNPKQAPAWRKNIDELSRRRDQLEAELSRLDAGFRAAHTEATGTLEQLAAALPESVPLVDLVRYNHRSDQPPGKPRVPAEPRYAAFITQHGRPVERIELGPAAPIDRALSDFRARVQQDGDDADSPGRELAKLVWTPLEPQLDGTTTVLLAPGGDLNFLPWAALPDPRSPGHYLIERYALATVGSGRQLLTQLEQPAPAGPLTLLAAGAVDYDRGDTDAPSAAPTGPAASPTAVLASRGSRAPASGAHYSPLPATGTEANAAADSFSRAYHGRADVLVGSHATKEALSRLLPGHRYLHLATHGYFAPPSVKSAANPDPTSLTSESAGWLGRSDIEGFYPGLLSGLAWAGANKPPTDPATGLVDVGAGTMTAEEVGSLDLSGCELAVLSACETGLGRTAGGEGVLGLQRAFHQAGCRTVVASLWKVDDSATAALMTRFYEHLWAEKLTPMESLRKAQLDMLEGRLPVVGTGRGIGAPQPADPRVSRVGKRVHPRYWAAWTVSGAPTVVGARAVDRTGTQSTRSMKVGSPVVLTSTHHTGDNVSGRSQRPAQHIKLCRDRATARNHENSRSYPTEIRASFGLFAAQRTTTAGFGGFRRHSSQSSA